MNILNAILKGLISGLLIFALGWWVVTNMLTSPLISPDQRIDDTLNSTAITGPADRVLIEKSLRRLTLFQADKPIRQFPISLGFAPEGDKMQQGDGKTPEGLFKIDRRNANSKYTLSLGINYPRPEDKTRAAAQGVSPGGDIFIHGLPNSMPDSAKIPGDWTAGCVAVTNDQIREIWQTVAMGTTVEIRP